MKKFIIKLQILLLQFACLFLSIFDKKKNRFMLKSINFFGADYFV